MEKMLVVLLYNTADSPEFIISVDFSGSINGFIYLALKLFLCS